MRALRALEENRWKTNRMFVLLTRDMDVASERQRFSEARRKKCETGRLSFGYFSLGEAKKSDSPGGERNFCNYHKKIGLNLLKYISLATSIDR